MTGDPDSWLDVADLHTAASALADGTTAESMMRAVLARAAATEPRLHAYASIDHDLALSGARHADAVRARGDATGALHGLPVGVKDVFDTSDLPTACGSTPAGSRARSDAAVVARLRAAGAVIVGKHALHEFALGMNDPAVRGPWKADHYAGGSSVGSAVSVAVGSCLAAIGTDAGGSVRKPAALNGIFGLKPTWQAVSRDGVLPPSSSMDHVGILARSAADCALLFDVLTGGTTGSGSAPGASSRSPRPSGATTSGLRIGVPTGWITDWAEPEVARLFRAATDRFADAGAAVVDVRCPELCRFASVHSTIVRAESYTQMRPVLESLDARPSAPTRRALLEGEAISATALDAAYTERHQLADEMSGVFSGADIDLLALPTCALSSIPLSSFDPRRDLPRFCRFTIPFNVTGLPALSVPAGHDANGMPVGIQLAGRPNGERTILEFARTLELRCPEHRFRPPPL
jgi:aspartyl-tRNA(Asn)/glutamyl-tRNA(Gln) amidotransferase subunit A